ncbi:MAG: HAMP domain-containing protein [Rhodobacteraceae bacterium]|nr:MAG: HAMP domain-containing protein [Paracoccaceae bacterium]
MALVGEMGVPERGSKRRGDVVLGDDWVAPDGTVEQEMQDSRARRGLFSLRTSPLTRKIIMFNLVALNVLVGGILYLNSSRDGLAAQRASGLISEAELIADVFEAQLPGNAPVNLATNDGIDVEATLAGIELRRRAEIFVLDPNQAIVGRSAARALPEEEDSSTLITDILASIWSAVESVVSGTKEERIAAFEEHVSAMAGPALSGETTVRNTESADGSTVFTVGSPIEQNGTPIGAVVLVSASGEIDRLVRTERERVLQMFLVATMVSIGLSLVLASTISNPISDLAEAAELGRDRDRRRDTRGRVRIPDLTARPDEIGRLSGALRGMVTALYDRIDANEQFAADVSHEIKNPLASLRSAVGSLRMVKREDHREKLLDVIDHDVRRLDRLVSDISDASRLDSELVKEDQARFNLIDLLRSLTDHLGQDAQAKGVEFITDLPDKPIHVHGLEPRLAQVFVNLITNAISFCEEGDAIRVWTRQRQNRVLIVVEDTGPGIPEEALTKIFKRFYSHRPEHDFGNNSGLGLAISKQIVEAHDGVIWAENIRPTEADITSEPLGARFVVGLPV